ncbi:TonB-dependent receptor plug domain-containing protein, partial [Salmonella enterica subsp. enterica serovar Montevideo]|nr:TonB-dependent receptor plug domain-containing protein [Salmonella enterica subsp. enterica serovar Montevideo]
ETMVVTASAIEQNLRDAPASISVITQQDLQRRPVQNLKDVLKSENKAVGQDYSRWNDVWLTLRGQYGARSTAKDAADPNSTVMY